jgi:hypothetical protein
MHHHMLWSCPAAVLSSSRYSVPRLVLYTASGPEGAAAAVVVVVAGNAVALTLGPDWLAFVGVPGLDPVPVLPAFGVPAAAGQQQVRMQHRHQYQRGNLHVCGCVACFWEVRVSITGSMCFL